MPSPTIAVIVPTPVQPADEEKGWLVYSNNEYGFRFRYPRTWTIEDMELSSGLAPAIRLKRDSLELIIEFHRVSDALTFQKLPVSPDTPEQGILNVLGHTIGRRHYSVDGKITVIAYGPSAGLSSGDLVFQFSLRQVQHGTSIPQALRGEAERILSTIRLGAAP